MMPEIKTDRDLAPIARTEANFWRAEALRHHAEVVRLNRACQRLSWKYKRLRERHNQVLACFGKER